MRSYLQLVGDFKDYHETRTDSSVLHEDGSNLYIQTNYSSRTTISIIIDLMIEKNPKLGHAFASSIWPRSLAFAVSVQKHVCVCEYLYVLV